VSDPYHRFKRLASSTVDPFANIRDRASSRRRPWSRRGDRGERLKRPSHTFSGKRLTPQRNYRPNQLRAVVSSIRFAGGTRRAGESARDECRRTDPGIDDAGSPVLASARPDAYRPTRSSTPRRPTCGRRGLGEIVRRGTRHHDLAVAKRGGTLLSATRLRHKGKTMRTVRLALVGVLGHRCSRGSPCRRAYSLRRPPQQMCWLNVRRRSSIKK